MPIYYIAMGQGILGQGPTFVGDGNLEKPSWKRDGPNFYVQTSTLPSCTLICGFNSNTGHGGAFHYPYGLRTRKSPPLTPDEELVKADLDNWLAELKPTQVTLINDHGLNRRETTTLKQWTQLHLDQIHYVRSGYGGMEILGDDKTGLLEFNAGNPRSGFGLHHPKLQAFDMRKLPPGRYEQRTPPVVLYGKDITDDALGPEDQSPGTQGFPLEGALPFHDTDEEKQPDSPNAGLDSSTCSDDNDDDSDSGEAKEGDDDSKEEGDDDSKGEGDDSK